MQIGGWPPICLSAHAAGPWMSHSWHQFWLPRYSTTSHRRSPKCEKYPLPAPPKKTTNTVPGATTKPELEDPLGRPEDEKYLNVNVGIPIASHPGHHDFYEVIPMCSTHSLPPIPVFRLPSFSASTLSLGIIFYLLWHTLPALSHEYSTTPVYRLNICAICHPSWKCGSRTTTQTGPCSFEQSTGEDFPLLCVHARGSFAS